jgi:hypothetical protein
MSGSKALDEVRRIAVQRFGNASDIDEADVPFTTLDGRHVGHVQIDDLSQSLLRVPELFATFTHAVAKFNRNCQTLTSPPHKRTVQTTRPKVSTDYGSIFRA